MKRVRGSATVEMAYIMPVVFFAFMVLMSILFYLHDKTVMHGAGYETMVMASQKLRWEEEIEEQMELFCRERLEGKLIRFPESSIDVNVVYKNDLIIVSMEAEKNRMKIRTEQKMKVVKPEAYIRNVRRVHGD